MFLDHDNPYQFRRTNAMVGIFETLATSQYDYSINLKEIIFEASSVTGMKAYRKIRSHRTCGKFMHTLLSLTLKKAKKLESFT